MIKPNNILIIIQRSNGDVFLSYSLVKALYDYYDEPNIDLLVNTDTFSVANLIPYVKKIHTFSYKNKQNSRLRQETNIVSKIFRKYDLSINLTASDRSVLYALLASKNSISAVEIDKKKSWWKKKFLSGYYFFDNSIHILENNLKSLKFLNINFQTIQLPIEPSQEVTLNIKEKLRAKTISKFLIFHPSAQYEYKIYPQPLRDALLTHLSRLGVSILITGSKNFIDLNIKKQIPPLTNVIDFIGETSIEEFIALSQLSLGYIGMDTLNMHIAASQDKPIFAIFGPTNLKMWAPWSNKLRMSATSNTPIQTYGNITIFQANMKCVACGKAGCDNTGVSECLNNIDAKVIFNKVSEWFEKK